MKLLNKYLFCLIGVLFLTAGSLPAQEEKPNLLIDIMYHADNNQVPYVHIFAKSKIEKKFLPAAGVAIKVYLGEEANPNLLGTVTTDKFGQGIVSFPVSVKPYWDTVSQFKLLATSVEDKKYASASNEILFTKARITIDTLWADGVRSVVATVAAKQGNEWKPVNEVETKIIIKRMAGNLSIGDKETYTTDSTGQATAEFMKAGMPGDTKGNIILVAKTEDNELYGSISVEKKVNWGVSVAQENTFSNRTLFATGGKSPLWLLFLAGIIALSVWSVIFYLIVSIIKIRKAGLQ